MLHRMAAATGPTRMSVVCRPASGLLPACPPSSAGLFDRTPRPAVAALPLPSPWPLCEACACALKRPGALATCCAWTRAPGPP